MLARCNQIQVSYLLAILVVYASLIGCSSLPTASTQAERVSGYTYVPIDPLAVCMPSELRKSPKEIADFLPDHSVRTAIETIDFGGNVKFGAGTVSGKIGTYKLTVDYCNTSTVTVPIWLRKTMEPLPEWSILTKENSVVTRRYVNPFSIDNDGFKAGSQHYWALREDPKLSEKLEKRMGGLNIDPNEFYRFDLPVYIGVGIRASAEILNANADTKITGLGQIGVDANSNNLRGTLVLQSIGISGPQVGALIPIQSDLNRTTAQNAIVTIAAIKPLIGKETEGPDVVRVTPRVVGIYVPVPADVQLINALVSAIASQPIAWPSNCDYSNDTQSRAIKVK